MCTQLQHACSSSACHAVVQAGNCSLLSYLHLWLSQICEVHLQSPCCICRWVSRGLNSDHAGISNTVCTTALHHCGQKSIVLAACACLLWVLAFVHCGCKQKGTLSGRVSFGCHVYQKVLNGVVIDVQGGSFQEGPMPFGNVPTHQYQPPTGLPSRRKALICGCNYRSPTSPICSFFSNNN